MDDNLEYFELKYAATRARAGRRLEEAALGQSVGLNGYTTVTQAQTLCDHLHIKATATLLEVGSGQGWPGSHIAGTTGCRLVSSDIPWDALLAVKLQNQSAVVSARGGALPFRANSFDAIVHADVAC